MMSSSKDSPETKDFPGRGEDDVFSVPQVPGLNGLPRERVHRHSGGGHSDFRQPPSAGDHRLIRIKSERELTALDFVKMEPPPSTTIGGGGGRFHGGYKQDTSGLFQVPSSVVPPPRRRESLPDEFLSFREHRRAEFDLPLNLTSSANGGGDRTDYRRTNSGPAGGGGHSDPPGRFLCKEEKSEPLSGGSGTQYRHDVYSSSAGTEVPDQMALHDVQGGVQPHEEGGSSRTVIGTQNV